jgi:exodeoxyribonuclease VII large subunit
MPFAVEPRPARFRDVYTVTRLNREAKGLLEGSFPLLWIEGEISNLARPGSGHVYFSLKDEQCQVRCALFRQYQRLLNVNLRDGLHVLLRARVSLYEGRGEFQLIVEHLEEAGEGALKRAFEALKARLAQEGLFDSAHKQSLPRLPRRIGVVTSPTGAVIHDILTTLRRRFPAIPVLLYPVPVQGEGAAQKIAAAIELAGRRRDCDALILARGGGSLEDLWAFNEEVVARAIHRCPVPVVTGIGHEVDFTIADFVADARAPTPTAAAELLSPHREEWLAQFEQLEKRLARLVRDRLLGFAQRLDWLGSRVVHPRQRLRWLGEHLSGLTRRLFAAQRARLHVPRLRLLEIEARLGRASPLPRLRQQGLHARHLRERIERAMRHGLERHGERFQRVAHALHTLSPLATLARGYAIVTEVSGAVLRDAAAVSVGAAVRARLARGELDCRVEGKREA